MLVLRATRYEEIDERFLAMTSPIDVQEQPRLVTRTRRASWFDLTRFRECNALLICSYVSEMGRR